MQYSLYLHVASGRFSGRFSVYTLIQWSNLSDFKYLIMNNLSCIVIVQCLHLGSVGLNWTLRMSFRLSREMFIWLIYRPPCARSYISLLPLKQCI